MKSILGCSDLDIFRTELDEDLPWHVHPNEIASEAWYACKDDGWNADVADAEAERVYQMALERHRD